MSSENQTRSPAWEAWARGASPCCGDAASWTQAEDTAAPACPMAGMCGGMMAGMSGGFRLLFVLFGLILLGLAAAIILMPEVLTWTAAAVLGFFGLGILVVALLFRRTGRDGAKTF